MWTEGYYVQRLRGVPIFRGFELGELRLHGLVAPGELLDGEASRLVVGEPEVVLRAQQTLLHLLQAIDGGVDVLDGGVELALGEVVVPAEARLEVVKFG